jgi:hypothetical protein
MQIAQLEREPEFHFPSRSADDTRLHGAGLRSLKC